MFRSSLFGTPDEWLAAPSLRTSEDKIEDDCCNIEALRDVNSLAASIALKKS
jgi:hypothetical protein